MVVQKEMEIKEEIRKKQQIDSYLTQIRNPFGALSAAVHAREHDLNVQDQEDDNKEKFGDHKFFKQEKALEQKLHNLINKNAQKLGIRSHEEVPWATVTKYVLFIYLVITCFSSFMRPDFMNLTAIAIGIYVVELPHAFRRWVFRVLVVFLLICFIYDIDDVIFMHSSEEDDDADGGVQGHVRIFSKLFTWLSLIFRPIVIIVFWKDSLDFMKIIRGQNLGGAGVHSEVQMAMNKYGGNLQAQQPAQPVFGLNQGAPGMNQGFN